VLFNRLRSFRGLFYVMREVANRWNEITLHGFPPEQIGEIFMNMDTPNLKKLRIFQPYSGHDRFHRCFPSPKVSCLTKPRLEEIEITSATLFFRSIQVNWDCITIADMSGISPNDAFQLLLLAPRLKSCTILCRNFGPPEEGTMLPPHPLDLPVTHTTLESFTFHSFVDDLGQFFGGVNLPSLKEFTFTAHTLNK
jgi:hypothetical protein